MGNDVSLPRKQRSKNKKQNTMTSNNVACDEDRIDNIPMDKVELNLSPPASQKPHDKKSPPRMETSADSFDRQTASRRRYGDPEHDHVVITDGLTNVKERYHINPKE
jgi:hypothetical protein